MHLLYINFDRDSVCAQYLKVAIEGISEFNPIEQGYVKYLKSHALESESQTLALDVLQG